MDMSGLYTAAMIVGYVVLGLLTVGVIIKIASVYARYKMSKQDPATIEVKQNAVLAIKQEQGEITVIGAKFENLPTEVADAQDAKDGEEA